MSKNYYHPDSDFYRKLGVEPPKATPHVTEEEILANMKQLLPNSWRMEGAGKLIGMTDAGPLVQFIGTDYICEGRDSQGMPILTRVKI